MGARAHIASDRTPYDRPACLGRCRPGVGRLTSRPTAHASARKRFARLIPQAGSPTRLHGGATTASWGFVRMAAPPRSSENRGMLRGAPALRPARASSYGDVGRWTARSTTDAALLVEQSANRRAGARA